MKKGIHPENYRPVVFKDMSNGDMSISYDEQKERPVILGEYIIETRSTVRAAAKKFGISKSTVHTEVTKRKMM